MLFIAIITQYTGQYIYYNIGDIKTADEFVLLSSRF